MSGAILLLAGLALLGAAVWLLLRTRADGEDVGATPPPPQPATPEPGEDTESVAEPVEEEAGHPATPERAGVSGGFGCPRRRRKQWASDHGFEYQREDRELAAAWPVTVLPEDPERAVVRDVVSGFVSGRQVHIGDVGEKTLLAMRRAGSSPVRVNYSALGAVPQGMRRTELLDQPPFYSSATDIRALDRMLDSRVEDALAALSHVAEDVAFQDNWVVVAMSRRLELSVWDAVIPQVKLLADAAMVLPPEQLSVPLELAKADATRPCPGSELLVPVTVGGGATVEAAEAAGAAGAEAQASHIRAVPRIEVMPTAEPEEADAEAESEAVEDELPAHAAVPTVERPDITRPAQPVDFPGRVNARFEEPEEQGWPQGVHFGVEGEIPSLGEDPRHVSGSGAANRPQVIRAEIDDEATIFEDGDEGLSSIAQRRRGGRGRHRAPEARHARPEPIEAVEYDIVEGEIVDIEERKK
ncbi:MAG TPA: hypothetical protein H9867_09865 [Candidatus Corynebacterium gallistercoris]|uniref:Secreted protein n=1 Tax=Candidatus Corynebacterium gallistercoris TaxID=2838530 RepID=A0A9D1US37_9CORY|nr:hypothetical protein [Candidatus Corynebacterium gallistercoris]